MAAKKKIRLFKIASEINIGKDAIVEFLQSKGFDVENKPTSILTADMAEAVYDKFKKEMRAAEKQRQKLEQHKQVRKSSGDESDETPTEEIQPTAEIQEADKQAESRSEDVITADDQDDSQTVVENETSEDTLLPNVKVGEVIDLDANKKSKKSQKSKKAEAEAKEKAQTKTAGKSSKVAAKADTAQTELIFEDDDNKALPESEDLTAETPEKKSADEPAQEIPEQIETQEDAPQEQEDFVEEEEDEEPGKLVKKKKKRKKIAEVEFDEEDDKPHLRGLTIVGKIDLKQEKKTDRKKKPKIVDPEDADTAPRKAKIKSKKRIKVQDKPLEKPKKERTEVKKKKKKSIREMITTEDVDKAIKKTLAGMEVSSTTASKTKMKHKKRAEREEKELKKQEELEKDSKILKITEFVTTSDLADLMNVGVNEIILKCMELGLMVTINQRLDKDTITLISDDYGFEIEFHDEKSVQLIDKEEDDDDPEDLLPRSPIVTIMGHVDHGKTSLLDFIRNANVVAGEAGGITQHIGAYRVELEGNKYITFLDTPGHEAFTAMRARGAQVTDIVVLVIAADDSVMPQTVEAISHAQAANVPIIVAINKVDKPDANPERIKQQLADQNILVEDWGGKYQCVEISAKHGNNVDILLERILLEAEMLDLKANPDRGARGIVIEANMDKGFGAVSTIIIQKGTLKIGDTFVAGVYAGKVRAMFDERNKKVESAGPSLPVRVIGFEGLPAAGDILASVDSEQEAREIANKRQQLKREQDFRHVRHMTLDDISKQIQLGGLKELFLIIKGDVSGSVEALSDSLLKLSGDEVRVVILHKGVGNITESDVMLAAASGAVIVGFQVSPTAMARRVAENEKVDIRLYSIIYDCINEIKLALEGLLTPDEREEVTGTVEVRQLFKISKFGVIAGCYVLSGKIRRNDRVRVKRDGLIFFNGTLHSLKRGKEDTKEVDSGYECGIMLEGFQDFHEGDIIEAYKIIEVKRTL